MKHCCIHRSKTSSTRSGECPNCAFIDDLVNEGPSALHHWFEGRRKDPCVGPPPTDYNGWSEVAQRVGKASHSAMECDDCDRALGFAYVACSIYEQVLPLMITEIEAMGFGNIGLNFTEIEAIDIRIKLINRFGPQSNPLASIESIESWFSNSMRTRCHSNDTDIVSFSREFRSSCIDAHRHLLRRLNPAYLTPQLRSWINGDNS